MSEIKSEDRTKSADELLAKYAELFNEFAPTDSSSTASAHFEIFSIYQPVELSYSAVTEQ